MITFVGNIRKMRIIFSIVGLLLCSALPAQIKVLKNESLSLVGKNNSVELYKRKNKYTITYQDINDSNLNIYRSFSFLDVDNDIETLYRLLHQGLNDIPKQEIQLELPEDIVGLYFVKNYGQPMVQFVHYIGKNKTTVGKSPFLTRANLSKIFDRPFNETYFPSVEKGTSTPEVLPQNQDNKTNKKPTTAKKKSSKKK